MDQEEEKQETGNIYIRDLPIEYVMLFNALVTDMYDERRRRPTEEAKRRFFMEKMPEVSDQVYNDPKGTAEIALEDLRERLKRWRGL